MSIYDKYGNEIGRIGPPARHGCAMIIAVAVAVIVLLGFIISGLTSASRKATLQDCIVGTWSAAGRGIVFRDDGTGIMSFDKLGSTDFQYFIGGEDRVSYDMTMIISDKPLQNELYRLYGRPGSNNRIVHCGPQTMTDRTVDANDPTVTTWVRKN